MSTESPACKDAAAGLERATQGVRPPGESVLVPIATRCIDDRWPEAAIGCFADMLPDDLGKCAGALDVPSRDALFAVLAGHGSEPTSVSVVIARLAVLKVGIADCDRFVTAVTSAMRCEQVPFAVRVQLGNETADFWSLPTGGLPHEAQQQIGAACGQSLAALERELAAAGCAL